MSIYIKQSIDRYSATILLALESSRQRLMDGVFEKYWIKPSRKKMLDVQNPPKESMTRLGICSMIIEPHVFEVNLYQVKDAQHNSLLLNTHNVHSLSVPTTNSLDSEGIDVTVHRNSPSSAHVNLRAGRHDSQTISLPVLPPFREGFAQSDPLQGDPPTTTALESAKHALPKAIIASSASRSYDNIGRGDHDDESHADPVIQMLAARAATNPELKSLMKVVAFQNASQDQLKAFQSHIDELNGIIHSQKIYLPPDRISLIPGSTSGLIVQQPPSDGTMKMAARSPGVPYLTNFKLQPLSQHYSQPLQHQTQRPVVQGKQENMMVVFDFVHGNGDRFLIPRYSIIEYLPGDTQVVVSFMVTRNGDSSSSGSYRDDLEYYQPFTLRLSSHNHRILESLKKAVAPATETYAYMAKLTQEMVSAEDLTPVIKSRGIKAETRTDQDAQTKYSPNENILQFAFSAPNSLLPVVRITKDIL